METTLIYIVQRSKVIVTCRHGLNQQHIRKTWMNKDEAYLGHRGRNEFPPHAVVETSILRRRRVDGVPWCRYP